MTHHERKTKRKRGGVYLIHFITPYKHAQHYIGYTSDLEERLEKHKKGTGARIMEVITMNQIQWIVAKFWRNKSRSFERSLKKRGGASRVCPICRSIKVLEKLEKASSLQEKCNA